MQTELPTINTINSANTSRSASARPQCNGDAIALRRSLDLNHVDLQFADHLQDGKNQGRNVARGQVAVS